MMGATAVAALELCGRPGCKNAAPEGRTYCSTSCGNRARKHRRSQGRRLVAEFSKTVSPCVVLADLAQQHAERNGMTPDESLRVLQERAAADIERGRYVGCWQGDHLLAVGRPLVHLSLGESARRAGERRRGTGS